MTADNIKDIILALIAGIFGGGLVFLTNWYKAKQQSNLEMIKEEDKHEIDSAKLALSSSRNYASASSN